MPRNWQAVVADFSDVMKLVHLAARWDNFDEEAIRGQTLRDMRRYYEDELTIQAARVGCPGRRGRLGNNETLTALNRIATEWGRSIVNTYNYDVAVAIRHIRNEVPRANRYVYARRLEAWGAARDKWKLPQIEQMTEQTARSRAQQDFYSFNGSGGTAVLRPVRAVCPICQGWVARGDVPLRVAQNHPPPYHVNCPHGWVTTPDRRTAEECAILWMGE